MTFYRWKKQYSGMEASEVRKMKDLQRENARLKKIVAEQALGQEALEEILKKKGLLYVKLLPNSRLRIV